jgi:AAA+ superfamily predicted ATPase
MKKLFLKLIIFYCIALKSSINDDIFTPDQINEIEKIRKAGITSEDAPAVIDIIRQNPWLTRQEAINMFKQQKQIETSLARSLDLLAKYKWAVVTWGSIWGSMQVYSLFKPFLEPIIQKFVSKLIFKNSIQPEIVGISFKDIAGYEEIKRRMRVIIKKINKMKVNGKLEKLDGVLFYGDPGCGKTLFAEAIAKEAGVSLFSVKASDLMNEAGNIEDKIKLLFEKIKVYIENYGPAILLIDEVDFLIASRKKGKLDSNEKIILQDLLSLLDGTKSVKGLLVIANTNYIDDIDIAMMRNGRLGVHIEFKLPSLIDIKALVIMYSEKLYLEIDKDFKIDDFAQKLLGKNVSHIIQVINNLSDFIKDNKYDYILTNSLVSSYEVENSLR